MDVLLSIRPEYTDKILRGQKRFEFRRAVFARNDVKRIYIYATSPVKRIIGVISSYRVLTGTPLSIWEKCKSEAGINEEYFYKYFSGKDTAHAIEIMKFQAFTRPVDPRAANEQFTPPQSFYYFDPAESLAC